MKRWWAYRSDRHPRVRVRGNQWRGGLWPRIGIVLGVGLVIACISMVGTATVYRNALRTRIDTAAQALSAGRIVTLKNGEEANDTQENYTFIEGKLARIKDVNSDARFVYLMARDTDGVYFLADSESDQSDANSPRGEKYPEASKELQEMFDNGRTIVEGPLRDSYGSWLSVLAPIVDDETYRIIAVVGMDVPASTYGLVLGISGGVPLLLAFLSAGVVYVRYQTWRRRQEDVQFRAEMLSIASHELRTPLTGLRWSQETLIHQKAGTPAQQHMLQIMHESTRRLQESIEDILQLASMESGKAQRLYLDDVDMRAILDDIVATQQLAVSQMNITIAFAGEWPQPLVLHVDAQRMKRVFHNVLSNVVKCTGKDTAITVSFTRSKTDEYVFVAQTPATGVSKEEEQELWSGLTKQNNSIRQHDVNDTDMGLYLARHILEQHGGRIWLESTEGAGTKVSIALPRSAGEGIGMPKEPPKEQSVQADN